MATKVKIRKTTTFILQETDLEHPIGQSLTVPDQTMSMKTIFERYVRGRPLDASVREPIYYGDDLELPDVKRMDLVEIGQMLENARENRELLQHQLETEKTILNNLELEKQAKEKQLEDERLLKLYAERSAARTNLS